MTCDVTKMSKGDHRTTKNETTNSKLKTIKKTAFKNVAKTSLRKIKTEIIQKIFEETSVANVNREKKF